jgi:hypothetical protein
VENAYRQIRPKPDGLANDPISALPSHPPVNSAAGLKVGFQFSPRPAARSKCTQVLEAENPRKTTGEDLCVEQADYKALENTGQKRSKSKPAPWSR